MSNPADLSAELRCYAELPPEVQIALASARLMCPDALWPLVARQVDEIWTATQAGDMGPARDALAMAQRYGLPIGNLTALVDALADGAAAPDADSDPLV